MNSSISSGRSSVGNRHPNSNNNNNSHDNHNMYPSGKSTSTGNNNNNNNNNNSNSNSGLYGLSASTNSNYDNSNIHNFDDIDDNHNTANSTAATTTSTTTSTRLTVNAHAFAGAILSPKHALELTPTLCLQIATALADLNHPNQQQQQHQQPKQSNHHHYSHHNSNSNYHTSHTNTKKRWVVPYTVWITEAWRVLGWAEPSAALFWEMATMYYALMIASRESMVHQAHMIPPILSCGSTSSFGSHGTTAERTPTHATSFLQQQQLLGQLHPQHMTTAASSADSKKTSSARMNSVVSAKELPLWLVGTFLILHCEELALQRNLSGHDERRFHHHQQQQQKDTITTSSSSSSSSFEASSTVLGGNKIDFSTLFQYPSLSPRYVVGCWTNIWQYIHNLVPLTFVTHFFTTPLFLSLSLDSL
jgi:hypothetical protein